jgi:hypothetical protein
VVTLAAGVLGCAACRRAAADRSAGVRLFVFIDQSASIKPGPRAQWEQTAKKLVRAIRPGCAFTLYPIHDQTRLAAPLVNVDVPEPSPDAGKDEWTRCRNAANAARRDASAAFQHAFGRIGSAPATDILSAFDRIRPDERGRLTLAVFFSDMVNSTTELDMERAELTPGTAAALITKLAETHSSWRTGALKQVRVYCLLNPAQKPVADIRSLERFYNTLVGALGAELALFDTHADAAEVFAGKGQRDAAD